MKLSTVIGAIPTLKKLMEQDLPVKQSYAIAKLARRVDEECNLYNSERKRLIEKYGLPEEDGKYTIPQEKIDDCNAELSELLNIDVEITEKIDILSTEASLTPAEVISIEEFIVAE